MSLAAIGAMLCAHFSVCGFSHVRSASVIPAQSSVVHWPDGRDVGGWGSSGCRDQCHTMLRAHVAITTQLRSEAQLVRGVCECISLLNADECVASIRPVIGWVGTILTLLRAASVARTRGYMLLVVIMHQYCIHTLVSVCVCVCVCAG